MSLFPEQERLETEMSDLETILKQAQVLFTTHMRDLHERLATLGGRHEVLVQCVILFRAKYAQDQQGSPAFSGRDPSPLESRVSILAREIIDLEIMLDYENASLGLTLLYGYMSRAESSLSALLQDMAAWVDE